MDIFRPLYLGIWQINWKKQIRRELKSEVLKHNLVELTFSKQDIKNNKSYIQFIRKDEFRYNNHMYDIVGKTESKDSVTYICYLDIKEMLQICSLMNITMNSGLLLPSLPLTKIKVIQFFDYINTSQFNSLLFTYNLISNIINNFKIISRDIEVNTPPPNKTF